MTLKTNYQKILKIMQPVLPHLTNECLTKFDEKKEFDWPDLDTKYLQQKFL